MTHASPFRPTQRAAVGIIFISAFLLYLLPGFLAGKIQTPPDAYYNQLAESFLHGRADIPITTSNYDLTAHNGRWYVPFPPLPAVLMMPWVALFGGINTVAFSALVGAANVALIFVLLEALAVRGWTGLSSRPAAGGIFEANAWLTALFGFGTVHWVLSTPGNVWFTAQICALTFAALAAIAALKRDSPLLAGAALAVAMLARPTSALGFPLLVGIVAQKRQDLRGPGLARWCVIAGLPLILATALLLLYNWIRFESPLDFGYRTANTALQLVEELDRYGQFSLFYVPQNLKIMLAGLPDWDAGTHRLAPNGIGMSLFLTTPAFLYLANARRVTALTVGAWTSIGLSLVPLLTYYNSGWHQFGYRFSLDFTIPLLVWLAAGLNGKLTRTLKGLILLSILINAWGTAWYLGLW